MTNDAARLIYVDDDLPGISRKRSGKGWSYYDPQGQLITDRAERKRLNAIALPPAYTDEWFCPAPNGHILATGYDAAGRKQYRYHPDFRTLRESKKFDGCLPFGEKLPLIRKRVARDIGEEGPTRARVLAAVVRLLDMGFIRIGNTAYARSNKSFGATTLRDRHAEVKGGSVRFAFRGKSGKDREVTLEDAELAAAVQDARDVPGYHLFQCIEPDGSRYEIGSGDVNDYLRETMGEAVSAKNFRTWHASVLAWEFLASANERPPISALLDHVSDKLGNTPTVARNSYIHPALIDLVSRDGAWEEWHGSLERPRSTKYASGAERGLIAMLQKVPDAGELLAA